MLLFFELGWAPQAPQPRSLYASSLGSLQTHGRQRATQCRETLRRCMHVADMELIETTTKEEDYPKERSPGNDDIGFWGQRHNENEKVAWPLNMTRGGYNLTPVVQDVIEAHVKQCFCLGAIETS